MKPRVIHGLDIAKYHSGPEVSKTGLDDLARSPAVFHALRSPGAPERSQTASQLHGNLAHCMVLEPGEFDSRYVVHPRMNRNTKAWREIEADCFPHSQAIQKDQFDTAMRQAGSVRSLQNVFSNLSMADILANGYPEPSAYWTDSETGVRCRCRPDWVHPLPDGSVLLIDLKTFGDATPRAFSKQVSRMRYHVQDAFYSEGFAAASGLRVAGFIFATVEDKFPYAAATYQLGDESRYEGASECRRLLDLYAECERTGSWPGYSSQTTVIDLPPYALTPQDIEISYV